MKFMNMFFKLMLIRRVIVMVMIIGGIAIRSLQEMVQSFSLPVFVLPALPEFDITPYSAFVTETWLNILQVSQHDVLLWSARAMIVSTVLLLSLAILNRIRSGIQLQNLNKG